MAQRILTVIAQCILLASAGGCAAKVAGAWEVVDVKPHGASFPFNRVTFDETDKYTATGLYDADGRLGDSVHTATGRVERKGGDLRLVPAKGTPVVYRTRNRLDGKLEMILTVPGQDRPVRAVLSPAGE